MVVFFPKDIEKQIKELKQVLLCRDDLVAVVVVEVVGLKSWKLLVSPNRNFMGTRSTCCVNEQATCTYNWPLCCCINVANVEMSNEVWMW